MPQKHGGSQSLIRPPDAVHKFLAPKHPWLEPLSLPEWQRFFHALDSLPSDFRGGLAEEHSFEVRPDFFGDHYGKPKKCRRLQG